MTDAERITQLEAAVTYLLEENARLDSKLRRVGHDLDVLHGNVKRHRDAGCLVYFEVDDEIRRVWRAWRDDPDNRFRTVYPDFEIHQRRDLDARRAAGWPLADAYEARLRELNWPLAASSTDALAGGTVAE